MDRLNNDPMFVGLLISKITLYMYEYLSLFLAKQDEISETYAFSSENIAQLVAWVKDEYRTDAAEHIVFQAVTALRLDFRRRRFIVLLRDRLAGLGTPISLIDYLKLMEREGSHMKNHIRWVPIYNFLFEIPFFSLSILFFFCYCRFSLISERGYYL